MNENYIVKNNDTNNSNSNSNIKHTADVVALVEKKILFFQDVIQKTILNAQKNKFLDILGVSEVATCITTINTISDNLKKMEENINTQQITSDAIISNLQTLNNDLSSLLKTYGTESLEDLLSICFGSNNAILTPDSDTFKFELLKKYFHPINYKVVTIKNPEKESTDGMKTKTAKFFSDDIMSDTIQNLDCIDILMNTKQFHLKVYGLKLYVYHSAFKKSLLITGVVDDIIINFLNNPFINKKITAIKENMPKDNDFICGNFEKFIKSMTLKDFLIYNNSDVYNKYKGLLSQERLLKQKTLSQLVKDFITSELFTKRNILVQLLINSDNYENKYMSYLLYDLLSDDANGTVDTTEQIILFDSFPWSIKQYFKEAMKKTIQYTNDLSNFEINKIPLEQQICLMKASDSVKEKAMMKLKEVKSKSEDSGSKARQYLDGLLKIPFSVYKKEPIMDLMNLSKTHFKELLKNPVVKQMFVDNPIPVKDKYTSIEILKYSKMIKAKCTTTDNNDTTIANIKLKLTSCDKSGLVVNIMKLNSIINNQKMNIPKLVHSGKKKGDLIKSITDFVDLCSKNDMSIPVTNAFIELNKMCFNETVINSNSNVDDIVSEISIIHNNFNAISEYMKNVKNILDDSVYGHDKAKRQIESIIAQWINGEQSGHAFGFCGPAGVGKTSLAKMGISNCLKDEEGNSRPFSIIQIGGDSNASTLHGHNYTYVGSTWGSIVQILIDKKCMNPIILIDELDKISKTEHGREIIGILTHLLDPTQNDSFQDKYFSGIDVDMSKVLFILSYNDVTQIDKILLDRIHSIKFSNLPIDEKLVIARKHMLPEIYTRFGLQDMVHFGDEVIKFIIETYTCEPGCRKLKEKLLEIVGEINLDILKTQNSETAFPVEITVDLIKSKYFKDKQEVKIKKIHTESRVGMANGMWANGAGQGGTLPIEAKFYPCDKYLNLKLTGMQGDVMQESMNVALTMAYSLTDSDKRLYLNETYNNIYKFGIHLHTPDASTQKNGPSGGCCITTVIYSLLNNKKIKYNFAMTGEITLDGEITAIGGLDLKILGSMKAGVTSFIFPEENTKDYDTLIEKYTDTDMFKNISFYPVKRIEEIFKIIFEEEEDSQ